MRHGNQTQSPRPAEFPAAACSAGKEPRGSAFGWCFEPSPASAGGSAEEPSVLYLEDKRSRYSFVRYDAGAGALHIQLDMKHAAGIPARIRLRFFDGVELELPLRKGDRFLTADARGLPSAAFEILFS